MAPDLEHLSKSAGNLPLQPTAFIGREWELIEVRQLLSTTRHLTLTGAGGVGKTRLALHVASLVADQFADGVWLVDLASLADVSLVPQTVATVLGIRAHPDRSLVEALVEALQGRNLLLLLDNCEHLADGCVRLIDALLQGCADLRLLATSRVALNVPGEVAWFVPSLRLPPDRRHLAGSLASRGEGSADLARADELLRYDAVRLFVARAQAVLPSFDLAPDNADAMEEICRQLDGIPLALELAAARVRMLTVEQIAERVHDRFRLLTTGSRAVVPRHQTLRALMDWSHDLLSEPEQTLFRRLSVFAGGWTLEAAEAITGNRQQAAGNGEHSTATRSSVVSRQRFEVLDLLSQLVDKSLVLAEQQGHAKRYRMFETLRQYGGEKLEAAGEAPAVRQWHLVWFRDLAERMDGGLKGPDLATRLRTLEAEVGNIRAALEWARQTREALEDGLRLGGALWQFWGLNGHPAEGEHWLSELVELAKVRQDGEQESRTQKTARAVALEGAGFLARFQRRTGVARPLIGEALALWRELGDADHISFCLRELGRVEAQEGRLDHAESLLEESLSLAREIGVRHRIYEALFNLGQLAHAQGERERAKSLFEDCLALAFEQGDMRHSGLSALNLGLVDLDQGFLIPARTRFRQALQMFREAGVRAGLGSTLLLLSGAAAVPDIARAADPLTSREHEIAALVARGLTNGQIADELVVAPATVKRHVENVLNKLALTSRAELASWATGQEASGFGPQTAVRPAGLSAREAEVLALLADGKSNRDIADALVLSVPTVERHIANIYHKIGVHGRAAATAYALRHGLAPGPVPSPVDAAKRHHE